MKMLISQTELDSKGSRDLIPLECLKCHTTHYRTKNTVLRILGGNLKGTRKGCFCSKKCGNEYNSKITIYDCEHCGAPIGRTPSQLGNRVFCSSSCAATYYNAKRKIIKRCAQCGNPFHPAHGNKGRFCSRLCTAKYYQLQTYSKIENGTYTVNHYNQKVMREYLIKVRGHRCEQCKNYEWQGSPINLTVDHIDGNSTNNLLTNVKLFCWNCHSMTPTFGRKNKAGTRSKRTLIYQKGIQAVKNGTV